MENSNGIELRSYVGTKVSYKGYNLVVAEVNKAGVRLYDPASGLTAKVTAEKFKAIKESELNYAKRTV